MWMIKTFVSFCLIILSFSTSSMAGERVDLSAPDQATIGTLTYTIARLVLDREHGRIVIVLVGDNNEKKEIVFGDVDNARAMMRALNKADLSTKSLQRRIMERLIADGHLAGTISGTPD